MRKFLKINYGAGLFHLQEKKGWPLVRVKTASQD